MREGSRRVITIDCHYVNTGFAAAYLLIEGDRAIFIEANTTRALPFLLDALSRESVKPENVDAVIVTHVHLDHAGGTSALLRACPNAKVLCHPRAARHLIDPSRLIASAKQVYGDQAFDHLYGDIHPVDSSRVREMADGEEIKWKGGPLRFLHTRGHANHHFCVLDRGTNSVFTGDAFGVIYPQLQREGVFAFPSTSPTDFDPEAAIDSVDRIVALGAKRVFPTHFDGTTEIAESATQLKEHLQWARGLLKEAQDSPLQGDALASWCELKWSEHMKEWLQKRGRDLSPEQWSLIGFDLKLNGAGVAFVAEKARKGT